MNSQRRLARINRAYDRGARRYDSALGGGLTARLTRRGRARVGGMVEGRLLEVGIGSGLSLAHYPNGVEVTGVDLSAGMLRICRVRAAEAGMTVRLLRADAQRLPFASASFDSVAFNLCLCTIPDPEAALREAVRVARPGARLVCLEHVRSNLGPVALLQDLVNPLMLWLDNDHLNRRTVERVRASGVSGITDERWALGVFTVIAGRCPG